MVVYTTFTQLGGGDDICTLPTGTYVRDRIEQEKSPISLS